MKNIILFVFFIVQSLNASLYVNVGGSSSSINSGFSMSNGVSQNKPQLDLNSVVTSAVTAGILSYANSTLGTNALKENMAVSDYVKNASINGVGQGISSEIRGGEFKDGFATGAIISVVSDGALQMRKYVKDNYDYVGKNGEVVPENAKSPGVRGDGVKLEGSHPSQVYDKGELRPNPVTAPLGGEQMGERLIFGMPYDENGFVAHALAAFAGPHDFMSSWNYQNINGATYLKADDFFTGTVVSGALIIPSIPFATAPYIQDYLDSIQNYRYLRKENEQIKEEAMNNLKDNR